MLCIHVPGPNGQCAIIFSEPCFPCSENGPCIDFMSVCDAIINCDSGRDELDCKWLKVLKKQMFITFMFISWGVPTCILFNTFDYGDSHPMVPKGVLRTLPLQKTTFLMEFPDKNCTSNYDFLRNKSWNFYSWEISQAK